jgi:thioredoxin-dependent peroxiredoxin
VPHLATLNVQVIGISPDTIQTQKKFDERNGFGYPLLSDKDHKIAEEYGVWQEKTLYGKKSRGIVRSSFMIDEQGNVSGVWYKVRPEETIPKALELLR